MQKEFNDVSGVKEYHAHIYFKEGQKSQQQAADLAQHIEKTFNQSVTGHFVYSQSSVDKKRAGPHAVPNHALHFKPEGFAAIVSALQMNFAELSVLIHPVTGDEITDHLDASMWMGKELPYNMEFFDQERARIAAAANAPKP